MRKPHLNGHQKDFFSNVLTVDGTYFDQTINSESNTSWQPELSSGDRVPASDSQRGAQSQDQTRAYNNPQLYSSSQYIYSNSIPTQFTYNSPLWNFFDENWSPQYLNSNDHRQPLNLRTPQPEEPRGDAEQPYVHRLQPGEPSVPNPIALEHPGSLTMPVQAKEFSVQDPSPCLSRSTLSPSAPAYPASTSSMGSPNVNHKVKMEAARMEDGLLHCAHADCVNEPRTFLRRCEYT